MKYEFYGRCDDKEDDVIDVIYFADFELKQATRGSSGFDLVYTGPGLLIPPANLAGGVTPCPVRVDTSLRLDMPLGVEAQVRGRSGLTSRGVIVPTGTVDSDYRGEVGVLLFNFGSLSLSVDPGERIGQIVFQRVLTSASGALEGPLVLTRISHAGMLGATMRGQGGFGSTGR